MKMGLGVSLSTSAGVIRILGACMRVVLIEYFKAGKLHWLGINNNIIGIYLFGGESPIHPSA